MIFGHYGSKIKMQQTFENWKQLFHTEERKSWLTIFSYAAQCLKLSLWYTRIVHDSKKSKISSCDICFFKSVQSNYATLIAGALAFPGNKFDVKTIIDN